MKSRWIVGSGSYLDIAFAAWKQPCLGENVVRIEMPQLPNFDFDLSVLDGLDPASGAMFVAIDDRFGNFKRTELMQVAMERGFKLDSFISPSAIVPLGVVTGPNVYVGSGVLVGAGSRIDFNTVVLDGVRLGAGVRLRNSCWLETGVLVADGVDIGAHCTLRIGAIVRPHIKVGRYCELGWARTYDNDIPSRTVFDPRYDEPIYTYGE